MKKIRIKKKDIIIIVFIFLIFVSFAYSFKSREKEDAFGDEKMVLINYKAMMSLSESGNHLYSFNENSERVEESIAKFNSLYNKASRALLQKDYKVYNLAMTKICLLRSLQEYELYETHIKESGVDYKVYQDYKNMAEELFKKIGMNPNEFCFMGNKILYDNPKDIIQEFPGSVLRASVYYEQYRKELPPLSFVSTDGASSVLHILESLLPYLLLVIAFIVCIDMISDDKKKGTLKLHLIQPIKRSRYLLDLNKRYYTRFIFILFIPIFMVFLIFGINDQYKSLTAPTIAYQSGVTSLKSIDNNISDINNIYQEDRRIYFGNIRINPSNPADMEPQVGFEIIPFWKLLLETLIYCFILILFYISLNLFFHVIISNPIGASFCFVVVAVLGCMISTPQQAFNLYNILNPFTYRNPVYAVTGYIGHSYLFSIMILLVYTIMINCISCFIFKRKDITS